MQEQGQNQSTGKNIFCWLITAAVIIIAVILLWPLFFSSEPELPSEVIPPLQEETTADEDITEQLSEGTTTGEIMQDLEALEQEAKKLLQDIETELQRMEQEAEQL
jgi:flagellar basal body-associated protein FliL